MCKSQTSATQTWNKIKNYIKAQYETRDSKFFLKKKRKEKENKKWIQGRISSATIRAQRDAKFGKYLASE